MDMTILSEQLFGLSFFLLWVLLAILLFSGVREGLSASPKDTDRVGAEDRTLGRTARYLLAGDRERRAIGLAMEAKARSYFGRRLGKIHLTAVAVLAATTLLLGVWNLHSAKIHREFRVDVGQR